LLLDQADRALEYLVMLSLLAHRLDGGKRRTS
jgi:hypothetical protein